MSDETIFAKILKGEIPSEKVYADTEFYAFRDANPAAPTHILIIPRKPIPKISDATEEDTEMLGRMLIVANKIAEGEGLSENGYRYVINNGVDGGQSVYHLHMHILGGRQMAWPPG
jgi:histidine triad (HIT) family protein